MALDLLHGPIPELQSANETRRVVPEVNHSLHGLVLCTLEDGGRLLLSVLRDADRKPVLDLPLGGQRVRECANRVPRGEFVYLGRK